MKLFIFKPSDQWDYCGGGLVVVASDFEMVKDVILESNYKNRDCVERFVLYKTENKSNKDVYSWVLVDVFEVDANENERVVTLDYNWA